MLDLGIVEWDWLNTWLDKQYKEGAVFETGPEFHTVRHPSGTYFELYKESE